MKVKYTENRDDFYKYKEDVWNMLTLSYEKVKGGLKSYKSYKDFKDRHHALKLVEYPDLIACATYRHIFYNNIDTLKMVAIGCDQTDEGKKGLKLIVRDDIKSEGYIFWAEASGAIEHYFEEFGGYKIANCYAKEILGKEDIELDDDGFHYKRRIGKEEEDIYTKIIYGFKDKETFERINKHIDWVELPKVKFTEKSDKDIATQLTLAYDIIEAVYSANEDSGVYELFPNWYDYLLKARQTLEKYENNLKRRDYFIEEIDFLLDTMPVIELKPLNID